MLTIEAAPDRLVFRALSRAESAYGQFTFLPSFFSHFSHPQGGEDPLHSHSFPPTLDGSNDGGLRGDEGGRGGGLSSRSLSPTSSTAGSTTLPPTLPRPVTVQVNSRMMQIPFRSGLSSVKRVSLRLCPSDDCGYGEVEGKDPLFPSTTAPAPRKRRRIPTGRPDSSDADLCLIIQLHLDESAVVKSYRLPTLELTSVLSPNFSRQSCPTVIGAKAKKFLSWLQNFPESSLTPPTHIHPIQLEAHHSPDSPFPLSLAV